MSTRIAFAVVSWRALGTLFSPMNQFMEDRPGVEHFDFFSPIFHDLPMYVHISSLPQFGTDGGIQHETIEHDDMNIS